ncbi:MAG: hypothetical protein ACK4NP_09925 [Parvularculaceae bacterium]
MEGFANFQSDFFGFLGDTIGERIAVGIAVASAAASVIVFLRNQAATTREARLARYDAVSRSYIELQTLCLQYPRLETSWYRTPPADQKPLTEEESVQRDILFDILTSTLERAFVTYRDAPRLVRESQWPGWISFARTYAQRDDYREWWRRYVFDFEKEKWAAGVTQYDSGFERFIVGLLLEKDKGP